MPESDRPRDTTERKPTIETVTKEFKNTGVTTVTQRIVDVGPDGRRRVMTRRIIKSPPNKKDPV